MKVTRPGYMEGYLRGPNGHKYFYILQDGYLSCSHKRTERHAIINAAPVSTITRAAASADAPGAFSVWFADKEVRYTSTSEARALAWVRAISEGCTPEGQPVPGVYLPLAAEVAAGAIAVGLRPSRDMEKAAASSLEATVDGLEELKRAAVAREDFDEAMRCKRKQDALRAVDDAMRRESRRLAEKEEEEEQAQGGAEQPEPGPAQLYLVVLDRLLLGLYRDSANAHERADAEGAIVVRMAVDADVRVSTARGEAAQGMV